MDLIITAALAQRILTHLVSQPTGSAKWSDVLEMVQALEKLQPAPAKPEPKAAE